MKNKAFFVIVLVVLVIFAGSTVYADESTEDNSSESGVADEVIVTDEAEIADEVGMSPEERRRVEYVRHRIGLKNYVVNQQFLLKLKMAEISSYVVINYIKEEMGNDTTELETIEAELEALVAEVGDGTNLTREDFIEMHKESKNITKKFKKAAHLIVTDGQDVSEIRHRIKAALEEHKEELSEIRGKELRARKVQNILSHRVVLKKLNRHVAALEANGVSDIEMKKKYEQFKNYYSY